MPKGSETSPDAVAGNITNNQRRLITDETPINPKYYDTCLTLLDSSSRNAGNKRSTTQGILLELEELVAEGSLPQGGSRAYPDR